MNDKYDYKIIDEIIYAKHKESLLEKIALGVSEWINDRSKNFHIKVTPPIRTFMMTHEGLLNIASLLLQVVQCDTPGEVIEIGCHVGNTAIVLSSLLNKFKSTKKKLILYDSFEGLRNFSQKDMLLNLRPGDLKTDLKTLKRNYHNFELKVPEIIVGNVEITIPRFLPHHIAFAHIDLDLYSPTVHSLRYILPRLTKKAIVVLDDYGHPRIRGVKYAVADVFQELNIDYPIHILYAGTHPPLSIWPKYGGKKIISKYQAYFQT